MGTRSRADIGNEKSGAKGPVDHSYDKWQEKVKTNPSDMSSKNEKCVECIKNFEKQQKKIECGFCEKFHLTIVEVYIEMRWMLYPHV